MYVDADLCDDEYNRKPPLSTWVSVAPVQVVAAADAGGVQRVNAEGGELATQLLDVAVFTVQRHLELQAHLVLLCYQLINTHKQGFNSGSRSFRLLQFQQLDVLNILNPVSTKFLPSCTFGYGLR